MMLQPQPAATMQYGASHQFGTMPEQFPPGVHPGIAGPPQVIYGGVIQAPEPERGPAPTLEPGMWVRFKGTPHDPQYIGKVFRVDQADAGEGNVLCAYEMSDRIVKKLYFPGYLLEPTDAPEAHELPPAAGRGPESLVGPAAMASQRNAPISSPWVRITSIPNRPQHDGKLGRVMGTGIPDAQGLLTVQLEGEATVLQVPAAYVQPEQGPATITTGPIQESGTGLQRGDRVRIRSTLPNHGGKVVTVETPDAGTDNVVVRFDDSGVVGSLTRLAVSPAHLETLDGQPLGVLEPNPQQMSQQMMGPPMMPQPAMGQPVIPAMHQPTMARSMMPTQMIPQQARPYQMMPQTPMQHSAPGAMPGMFQQPGMRR